MSLNLVSEQLLAANGLKHQDLFAILGQLAERRLDYGDLYFQSSYHESWVLEDRIIKDGSYNIDQGVGVRAISGEKTGFAYADQISLLALEQSAQAARTIVRDSGDGKVQTLGAVEHSPLYTSVDPLQSMSREEKLDILRRVDKVAREADKRVQEVTASLSGVYELILVAATDGTLAADVRPLVRLSVSVLVEEDGKRERGASGGGGRFGYEFFLADLDGEVRADAWAKEAVRMALVNLSAVAAPAGTMPVVLGAGWPGVLLHEAVGHGLEGDFNRRGTSVFSGQVGELVASELCTVVDDGTMVDRRGSVAIDDEGTPGQYNVLIENGILKGYMQDKLNARLMGMTPTGNGRRESYAHLPMPRMTNTYMPVSYTHLDVYKRQVLFRNRRQMAPWLRRKGVKSTPRWRCVITHRGWRISNIFITTQAWRKLVVIQHSHHLSRQRNALASVAGQTHKYDAQSAGSGGKNSVALTVISPFLAIR